MHPIFIEILGRPIYWYGVFVALGFLAAVWNWNLLAKRDNRPAGFGSEMGFWAMVAGLLGARLAYVLANIDHYAVNPIEIIRFDQGGLIFYGGFLGGFLGLVAFAKKRKISFLDLGDYAVTGLVLGHVFGRIGCFLNGCCFGTICSHSAGISFPPGSPASIEQTTAGLLPYGAASLPVYPIQLYEAAFNLLVYGVLVYAYLHRRRPGRVGALYLMLYPAGRFLFEFLRGDPRVQVMGLSVAQALSLVFLIAGGLLWLALRQGNRS